MKTKIRFVRSLTAVHVAAVLALAAPPVFGQAATPTTENGQQRRGRSETVRTDLPAESASKQKFDIEIADGSFTLKGKKAEATLPNVIELLREMHNGANIVLSPGLPRIRIDNLKLRATSLEQELEALRVASGNKFMWSDGRNPGAEDVMSRIASSMTPPGGPTSPGFDPNRNASPPKQDQAPLYILSEIPAGMAVPGRQVEVFNLTGYLNSFGDMDEESRHKRMDESLAEIKSIVTTTLQLVDEDRSAVIGFQFHAGANLLVVSGTPDALEVARKVVSALGPQNRPGGAGGFGAAGLDLFGNPYRVAPFGTASSASSKARRAIASKLESIRLETVGPWNLPLPEIVRLLNDEAKKRDPEKRGINFLINPNPPQTPPGSSVPGAPGAFDPTTGLPVAAAPAAESTDINTVIIKIDLPLTNVRLVDILDAMVKVADHPIRYHITDYAVVFSLGGPEIPTSEAPFPGAAPGLASPLP